MHQRTQWVGRSVHVGILLISLAEVCLGQKPADTIFHNGDFYTVNPKQPRAQAIATRDGRIIAVGANQKVLSMAIDDTRLVDLQGAFVVPGFIDTHVHFASAVRFHEFNLMKTTNQSEFAERVTVLANTLPTGKWITGGYWGAYEQWKLGSTGGGSGKSFVPDMARIEFVTRQHPLFIRKFDDSEFAANRAGLAAAGIDPDHPQQRENVEFIYDNDRFSGRMRGNGVPRLFEQVIPKRQSYERRMQQTRNGLKMAARYGVTSVSDMSDDQQLDIYQELRQRGELSLRIHFRYELDRWQELAQRGIKIGSGDEWIRLGGLKGYVDGIMGTSSARFYEPYATDPSNRGQWRTMMKNRRGQYAPEQFLGYMLGADKAGLQITVHAIGDEANHLLLDFVETMIAKNGRRDRRFRLVHAQVIGNEDFPRLGELDVIAEVQPFHLSDDMRWMELRIGRERSRGAYAFERIKDSGAMLCFGSDWPGTSAAEYPINPLLAIYAAVTRQTINGTPIDGWFPDERLDIETAIRAHTLNAAYASFEEDIKGSIEVGKLADLAVLSNNILEVEPTQLLQTKFLHTVVNGQIVYSFKQQ